MECDQCGARRPRTGPCPECGAPPPGSYSSMRQWRDQARTGKRPAAGGGAGGRGSGTSWGSGGRSSGGPAARGGRGSGTGWRTDSGRGAEEWAGDEYDEGPPQGWPGGRNTRGAADYEEVDLERALVPQYGDMLPMQQGMGAVALPGMPATDEEERALGIRRPVYIPATGDRKRKLGTWRVVSGVLSIMLVCVASCSLAGILGRNHLTSIWQGPVGAFPTAPSFPASAVPVTPVATTGPASKYVENVVTATAVDANYVPINTTSHFLVNSDVYVVASVRNVPQGQSHIISIHWFLQGLDLNLVSSSGLSKTITKDSNVYFSLRYTTTGLGTAKIYFDRPGNDTSNGAGYLAATINFGVSMPATPSPSPKSGTSTGTPGKTPSPSSTQTPKASTGVAPVAWRVESGAA